MGADWTGRDSDLIPIGAGSGRGALGAGIGATGRGAAGTGMLTEPSPKKSPTRVSTNWLIEMLFASQNALSRSYVVRLTLMLRRVCFLAIINPYATGSGASRRSLLALDS